MRLPSITSLAVLVGLTSLTACSGGGCGSCTVPAFHTGPPGAAIAATPTPVGFVPTPTPAGFVPTPTPIAIVPTPVPPGFVPTPVPLPTPTPTPTPTPGPVALSCAQNALLGQAVNLRSASTFAVLGGSTVTSSGPTIVTGDLGLSPGTAITGFGPGTVVGTIHAGDPTAAQAQLDLTTAYNDAAGRAALAIPADIGGTVIPPGVYKAPVSLTITGNVTLDGRNDPNSVFIFQAASTLVTATNSSVTLIGGANACNVFWQVGSSATINGLSVFKGNVLALASISVGTNASVTTGRLLARSGAVTLLSNVIINPGP